MIADLYASRTVEWRHGQHAVRLRVSQELFSSHDVDIGTQRLLRTLAGAAPEAWPRVLDLGCGYGPLGLALKALGPGRAVHLVDRDALAVEFARHNAALNGLTDVEVYASPGYDDLRGDGFDLVVCNVPAKAGTPVVSYLLREAAHALRPGGLAAVVVVAALEDMAAALLADPGSEVVLRKAWPGHTVFHYRFTGESPAPPASALERGVYDHHETPFLFGGRSCPLVLAHGLPEMEGLGHESELLIEGLQELAGAAVGRAVVLNPRQGHVPVALWQLARPAEIALVDRDLLALRHARRNLLRNGCPQERVVLAHQVGLGDGGQRPADLVAGAVREEEGQAALAAMLDQAAAQVAPGGTVVLAGSSTAITRLAGAARAGKLLAIRRRGRSHGKRLLVLQRR